MDLIVTHLNADFDALASLVAARKLFPEAKIILPSTQERGVHEFITLAKDLVKIEEEKNIDLRKIRRLIVVDTRIKNRLGKIADFLPNKNIEIFIFDHHPRTKEDMPAKKDIFEAYGATVTILLNLIRKKRLPLSPLEATIFALGIYEDTGSLTFQTTTKKDIDMISFLFSQGANLSLISSYLNRELIAEEKSLLASLLNSTKIYSVGGLHIAISTFETDKFTQDLALITHKLLEIENINVIFTLVKIENRIQMIARSRLKNVDVSKIVKEFGGGGHPSAASATIKNQNFNEVLDKLLELLRKNIKSELLAKDVMSVPVKTLTSSQLIKEAKAIMCNLKIKGMPVVERGNLIGIITKNDLKRAIHHGFGHARIKGYMTKNVIWVNPFIPVSEIQRILAEKNIGRLPVLSRGRLVGLVSRTDVFKGAHEEILNADYKLKKKVFTKVPRARNLHLKMKTVLPKRVYQLLKKLGEIADKKKIGIYVVGGFVRDLILGKTNFDLDIVVEANAIEFAKYLTRTMPVVARYHKRFKTAIIKFPDGLKLDMATARREFYEYPAALPVVNLSSIKQDLYRRDFTINTLAIRLNSKAFGELIDFFGAQKDLFKKKIRVLHDLSFVEDPTRILRAVRFEQRFDFSIDKHTENLIKAAVDLEMFDRLHEFRLADELVLLLSEVHPLKVIKRMSELHELKFIHPKIKLNKNMIEFFESAEEVLGWYKLSFTYRPIKSWIVFLLILLNRLSKKQSQDLVKRFGLEKFAMQCLRMVKLNAKRILRHLEQNKKLKPSQVYKLLKPLPQEVIIFLMAKTKELKAKEIIMQFLTKYANIRLEISGDDLKKVHPHPGPNYKIALEKTLFAKIDGSIHSKEEELNFARRILCVSVF